MLERLGGGFVSIRTYEDAGGLILRMDDIKEVQYYSASDETDDGERVKRATVKIKTLHNTWTMGGTPTTEEAAEAIKKYYKQEPKPKEAGRMLEL